MNQASRDRHDPLTASPDGNHVHLFYLSVAVTCRYNLLKAQESTHMEEQSYAKHAKYVPMYHFVTFGLIFISFLGSLLNLYRRVNDGTGRLAAIILVLITFAMILVFFFARVFPLRAQDRAIRAEENLRHFALTGRLLDPRLNIRQIIGLRFAPDAEFVALAARAADEGLSMDAIKKSIKVWKADHDRM